ncbi:hypothetical protein [Candidatus Accumulibacter sp. ACC003]|uniref:hypothetical protein n=1 Tax=Candidatus Accumulibacter sp. ACC003 TaxID=2823334 RepID=UPI0025C5D539|nr:hypothetical protein [Candidatus Accumulibacter sp. ACC003]
MRTVLAAILLVCASSQVLGQQSSALRLSDLHAGGATQLSKDELHALLPGAKVESRTVQGSTRLWENVADGSLLASSDNRGDPSTTRNATARGTWQLADNGTYCVLLEWKRKTEQWCRFIFKSGDKYFAVKSTSDQSSVAHELVFSR